MASMPWYPFSVINSSEAALVRTFRSSDLSKESKDGDETR